MGSDGAPPGTKGRDRVGEQGTPKGQTNDSKVYTDSGPRERLKAEIGAGDGSGRRGQWSARKAQLLARAYEEASGGDTTEERTEAPCHLVEWTDAEWTSRDGGPAIRGDETARYLPKDAWQRPTPAEHRATDVRKREGSRTGEQFAPNTGPACEARKKVSGAHGSDRDEGSARAKPAVLDTDPLPCEMDSLAHRYVGVDLADGRRGVAGHVLTTADGHLYDLQAARGEPT